MRTTPNTGPACLLSLATIATTSLAHAIPPAPPVPNLPMASNSSFVDEEKILSEDCAATPPSQNTVYPSAAAGVSGTVVLLITMNRCGQIRRAEVRTSSGSGVLDQAAVKQALSWAIAMPAIATRGLVAIQSVHFEYDGPAQSEALANYDQKLGEMHGVVAAVGFRETICSDAFPQWQQTIHESVISWRKQFRTSIDRIDSRFHDRLWEFAENDAVKFGDVMRRFSDIDAEYEVGLRRQMMADGAKAFSDQCEAFPQFLTSPQMDLTVSFENQLAVVEAGRPADVASSAAQP